MYRVLPPYWNLKEFSQIFKKTILGEVIEGNEIKLFKEELSKVLGTPNIELTSSGRTAIYIALSSLDLDRDTEVIVPSFICEEAIRPILQKGLKLRFVDIKEDLTIDPEGIIENMNSSTRIILMPHVYGKICDYKEIKRTVEENGLVLIDDAAPVLGYYINGKPLGSFGDFGIYSMNYKALYSIYGGAITYKEEYKDKIGNLMEKKANQNARNLVKLGFFMCSSRVGYKFSKYNSRLYALTVNKTFKKSFKKFKDISIEGMSNITASIGLIQLKKHKEILKKRVENSKVIEDILEDDDYVKIVKSKNDFYVRFVIQIDEEVPLKARKNPGIKWEKLTNFREYLFKKRIETLPVYTPIHLNFLKMPIDLATTEELWRKCIIIPNNPLYSEEDMKYIGEAIKKYEGE